MVIQSILERLSSVDRGNRPGLSGMMAVALLGCAGSAAAATTPATPDTIVQVIDAARPGDTIRLSAGIYPVIELRNRNWQPAITVVAGDNLVKQVALRNVTGFHWQGGKFDGEWRESVGFGVRASQDIVVKGGSFRSLLRNGVVIASSSDVDVIDNRFSDMGSDGIQVAESRRMTIADNRCENFRPVDKAHPDCIQLWSRPTNPPSADIIIRNNVMSGAMQGIGLFNHVRNGVDDGGFDRITIIGNDVAIQDFYHGIALHGCRGCLVRDNKVKTLPGGNPRIRAWIRIDKTTTAVACGNAVSAFPGGAAASRCRADVPMAVSRR